VGVESGRRKEGSAPVETSAMENERGGAEKDATPCAYRVMNSMPAADVDVQDKGSASPAAAVSARLEESAGAVRMREGTARGATPNVDDAANTRGLEVAFTLMKHWDATVKPAISFAKDHVYDVDADETLSTMEYEPPETGTHMRSTVTSDPTPCVFQTTFTVAAEPMIMTGEEGVVDVTCTKRGTAMTEKPRPGDDAVMSGRARDATVMSRGVEAPHDVDVFHANEPEETGAVAHSPAETDMELTTGGEMMAPVSGSFTEMDTDEPSNDVDVHLIIITSPAVKVAPLTGEVTVSVGRTASVKEPLSAYTTAPAGVVKLTRMA